MTAPQTTDEIAAYVRNANRANPQMADATRASADEFAAHLKDRLPYLDPADIAAVLLHTSSFLATAWDAFTKGGLDQHRATVGVINIVAHAGERMDRKARRGSEGS